jgi:predicted TIM-barrel fold metal-dependent hydrolase
MPAGGRRIDCDVHCGVPDAQTLARHLPEEFREYTYLLGFSPAAAFTYPPWLPMLATPPADLTLERLQREVLDAGDDVRAIVNCYLGVESFPHPYLGPALASAVNRWLQEAWLERDARLWGSAVITPQHTSAAVQEIHRIAADRRFVQIAVPARSTEGYGQERYWPIWEAAAEHDLPIAIVYGGVTGAPPTPVGWLGGFFEHYVTASTSFQGHVLSLTASGIFSRLPTLKVVLVESGWTWLPGVLWRFDEHWRMLHREVPWLEEPPSSYVRRHFRVTTEPVDAPPEAGQLRDVLEQVGGAGLLLFGSDYPHRYGNGQPELLDQLMPAELEQVLWSNADAWYGGRG